MPDAPYVPTSRLEKVPPSQGSVLTAWAVDLVVAAVVWVGTAIITLVVLSAWALHPGPGSLAARLDPWASWTAAILALVFAVLAASLGRNHRSPGRQIAEVKSEDLRGGPATAGRRVVRAAVPLVVTAVLAPVSWILAPVALVAVVATCVLTPDRRGLPERVAGLRDYQTDLVDVVPGRVEPAP